MDQLDERAQRIAQLQDWYLMKTSDTGGHGLTIKIRQLVKALRRAPVWHQVNEGSQRHAHARVKDKVSKARRQRERDDRLRLRRRRGKEQQARLRQRRSSGAT